MVEMIDLAVEKRIDLVMMRRSLGQEIRQKRRPFCGAERPAGTALMRERPLPMPNTPGRRERACCWL